MFMRLLLALPIILLPNMLHVPIDTGIPGLNLANVLFLALVLALVLGGRSDARAPIGHGQLTFALLGWFLMLVVGFAIAQMTPPLDFMADFTSLKNAIFYPLFYFVYRRCGQNLQGTRQLIILTMVVAALAGVEAIRQILDYGVGDYLPTHRASGPFGKDFHNANRAGVFYAMFLPMFLAIALFFRGQKFWRLAATAGCVILALAIMATYSRQAYLIALFGLALLLLRRSIPMAVLAGVLMVASVNFLPDSVTQRVQETQQHNVAGGDQLDLSTASRFDIWAGGLRMWRDHPMGVGLNRFHRYIGEYTSYVGYDAHNFYMLTLAECGPLGLAALLWLLWNMWRLAHGIRRTLATADTEARALALGFPVVLISMALGNVFGSPFTESEVMADFWILCALLERYATLKRGVAESLNRPLDLSGARSIRTRFPLASRHSPGGSKLAVK